MRWSKEGQSGEEWSRARKRGKTFFLKKRKKKEHTIRDVKKCGRGGEYTGVKEEG